MKQRTNEAMVLGPTYFEVKSLAVGAQGFVPEAATSHGVLKDTFRHNFSLLRSHEGGHLHSHRPRRSDGKSSFMYDLPELGMQVGG